MSKGSEVVDRNALYRTIHGIIDVLDREERTKLLLYIQEQGIRIYQHADGSRINLTTQTVEDLILIKAYARSLVVPLSSMRKIDF